MPRAKGGFKTKRRVRKILKAASGYWGGKSTLLRHASEAVDRARKYAYRDRRVKKRDFRALWIMRINAAARINDFTYRDLIFGLKKANVDLNRKVLADLAVSDPSAFTRLVDIARSSLQ